ncbi:MAG: methyl-accepting chemotaxis protein [Gammaproteobacteria bacterium]|nr:MAG: methyl-accepting chemotaxis protein [Gammaproteobacteria bacterium]
MTNHLLNLLNLVLSKILQIVHVYQQNPSAPHQMTLKFGTKQPILCYIFLRKNHLAVRPALFKIKFICQSVRNKLLFITGLGTALVLAATIWGFYSAATNFNHLQHVVDEDLALKSEVQHLYAEFNSEIHAWKNVLLRGADEDRRNKYWGRVEKSHNRIQTFATDIRDELINVHEDPTTAAIMSDFLKHHQNMFNAYSQGVKILAAEDYRAADQLVEGVDRKSAELLNNVIQIMDEESQRAMGEAISQYEQGRQTAAIALAVAVVISFILFLFMIQKTIIGPARQLMADLGRMAEGDFTRKISVASADELGQVASSAQTLQHDIGHLVRQINESVFRLSASAEEMAHVTERSNQSMMQQRNETDQVATAMNEMTATVHEVAQNAQLAADSANQANVEVNTGQGVVNEAIRNIASLVQKVEQASDVIHNVESNSEEIGTVLDVIRGIAEQTNLLALNAAIEAARAGEQGRGFAVVADEVRVLAQRTQKSTEEIQQMIQKLQAGAQEAVDAMNQSRSQADVTRDTAAKAGQVLNSITRSVNSINDMNTLIASAAEEQNAVAEEINRNIVNISQVAETTAESAVQTANASEELRNVAEELKHVIAKLRV